MKIVDNQASAPTTNGTPGEVFRIFLRLGCTSFGGPIAHLGYFREEFVNRQKWVDEHTYADIVALCQFLPGPASSQVGIAVGLSRAGYLGALAAWLGFTMPSAIALTLFALGLTFIPDAAGSAWIHGLKIAAVAVVAQAVLGMMRSLAPDKPRATLMVMAAIIALAIPSAWGQLAAIAMGAIAGLFLPRPTSSTQVASRLPVPVSRVAGGIALALFFILLAVLPIIAAEGNQSLRLVDSFYRSGSLVFGGGHVVLPLLQAEVVLPGWVSHDQFLAGYGAAQAVPGPLFTFAAYLGAVIGGWPTALLCLAVVFLPSFLLVIGAMPFWDAMRRTSWAPALLRGINAAVVGLLLGALYTPVFTSGIKSATDFAIGIAAFLALHTWRVTPWLVVLLSAITAGGLGLVLP